VEFDLKNRLHIFYVLRDLKWKSVAQIIFWAQDIDPAAVSIATRLLIQLYRINIRFYPGRLLIRPPIWMALAGRYNTEWCL